MSLFVKVPWTGSTDFAINADRITHIFPTFEGKPRCEVYFGRADGQHSIAVDLELDELLALIENARQG